MEIIKLILDIAVIIFDVICVIFLYTSILFGSKLQIGNFATIQLYPTLRNSKHRFKENEDEDCDDRRVQGEGEE